MIKKVWHIQKNLYFEELSDDVFSLDYSVDESSILLLAEEIDDIIDALRMIKLHYQTKELAEQEKEKLAVWGKAKIPAS
jgi:hypothetical protein